MEFISTLSMVLAVLSVGMFAFALTEYQRFLVAVFAGALPVILLIGLGSLHFVFNYIFSILF